MLSQRAVWAMDAPMPGVKGLVTRAINVQAACINSPSATCCQCTQSRLRAMFALLMESLDRLYCSRKRVLLPYHQHSISGSILYTTEIEI